MSWILDWDWPAAERRLRQAIALDPGAVNAHRTLGHLLSQMGRAGEAQAAMTRARELDPLDLLSHALSSQVAFQGSDGTRRSDMPGRPSFSTPRSGLAT